MVKQKGRLISGLDLPISATYGSWCRADQFNSAGQWISLQMGRLDDIH